MYIYKINIVFEGEENLEEQSAIDDTIEKALSDGRIYADYASSEVIEIHGNNYGRCCKCGCWTSDHKRDLAIDEFSDGIYDRGKWYCDICVSADTGRRF